MSIELPNGEMLNLIWVKDCYVDKHNNQRVVIEMVNGVDKVILFENQENAKSLVDSIKTAMKQ